jgi:F0F1-type ATP synthase beta subunit
VKYNLTLVKTVRTISMDSTDGLSRGYEVVGTGYPIQMPIGADVYGRLFNVMVMRLMVETYQNRRKRNVNSPSSS